MLKKTKVRINGQTYEFPKDIVDELIKSFPKEDLAAKFNSFLESTEGVRVEMKYKSIYVFVKQNDLVALANITKAASEFVEWKKSLGESCEVNMSSGYLRIDCANG